jgi:hypothetical protein
MDTVLILESIVHFYSCLCGTALHTEMQYLVKRFFSNTRTIGNIC